MLSIVASDKWGHGYGTLPKTDGSPYKTEKGAFRNHPCTKWVMQSSDNYKWLYDHGIELLRQYTLRYDKVHSMQALYMNYLIDHPTNISVDKQTPFAQAMPEQYRNSDAVTAYRNYYIGEKKRFAKWAKTPMPSWF